MEENDNSIELQELRQAARIGSIYHRNNSGFKRNTNLSEVMHAVLHLSQFVSVLIIELFHHIHHVINKHLGEKNPDIPELPDERNPVFFGYLISPSISILLCLMWIFSKEFGRKIEIAICGCIAGIIFMLLSAIFTMRHAELYINIEEVSDEELLAHPIFIHNFVLCILSIFSLGLFLLHFWILYDCYQWKKRMLESGDNSSNEESTSSDSGTSDDESHGTGLRPIPSWDTPHRDSVNTQLEIENEPVILYCCCLDCWNYLKQVKNSETVTNEFQVIHVM